MNDLFVAWAFVAVVGLLLLLIITIWQYVKSAHERIDKLATTIAEAEARLAAHAANVDRVIQDLTLDIDNLRKQVNAGADATTIVSGLDAIDAKLNAFDTSEAPPAPPA